MGAGLTQLHNGDLVVVNQAEHSLYLSVYNANTNTFATPTLLTLSGTLTTPTGIARNSTNELFVADKGSKKIFRLKSASGEFLTSTFSTCAVFSGYDSPVAVQFSADDTLYVATQNSSPLHYPGKVWAIPVTTSGCGTAQVVAKLPQWDSDHDSESTLNSDDEFAQAFGLALPPTATAPQTKSFTNSTTSRNFNFNADTTVTTFTSFQLSNPVPTYCSATLSAIQSPAYTNALGSLKAAVAALISSSALPSGTLVPYLGEAGFGTVYDVSGSPACGSGSVLVGAFTKDLTNPRLIHCHLGIANGCDVVAPNAIYPLSGPIPGDGAVGGKVPNFSQFFVVDVGLSTASGVAGTFCGFNPPLNNTTSPTGAPVFDLSDTGTIPVKFQLGLGANCNKQITNATALLSVARVDSGFTPIIPLKFNGHGGSTATFDVTGKQYHLNLDVTGYAPGTYSVTVTFLSGNAPPVTTYFKLVP